MDKPPNMHGLEGFPLTEPLTGNARKWLAILARHYPSLLVSGVAHAALGEIERLENQECLRFYDDLYQAKDACHE